MYNLIKKINTQYCLERNNYNFLTELKKQKMSIKLFYFWILIFFFSGVACFSVNYKFTI